MYIGPPASHCKNNSINMKKTWRRRDELMVHVSL